MSQGTASLLPWKHPQYLEFIDFLLVLLLRELRGSLLLLLLVIFGCLGLVLVLVLHLSLGAFCERVTKLEGGDGKEGGKEWK